MLKFYYQWRHKRAQAAASFKLPGQRDRALGMKRVNLGSYLSQNSVRGYPSRSIGMPHVSCLWLRRIVVLLVLAGAGWMIYQSALAFIIFAD